MPSPSWVGETKAQASDGHVANMCQSWDRNSNGMILSHWKQGPPCFFLLPPPLTALASPRQWRTGAYAPKPPCQCSAKEQNIGSQGKSEQLVPLSTSKRATEQVCSEDVMTSGRSTDFRVRMAGRHLSAERFFANSSASLSFYQCNRNSSTYLAGLLEGLSIMNAINLAVVATQ